MIGRDRIRLVLKRLGVALPFLVCLTSQASTGLDEQDIGSFFDMSVDLSDEKIQDIAFKLNSLKQGNTLRPAQAVGKWRFDKGLYKRDLRSRILTDEVREVEVMIDWRKTMFDDFKSGMGMELDKKRIGSYSDQYSRLNRILNMDRELAGMKERLDLAKSLQDSHGTDFGLSLEPRNSEVAAQDSQARYEKLKSEFYKELEEFRRANSKMKNEFGENVRFVEGNLETNRQFRKAERGARKEFVAKVTQGKPKKPATPISKFFDVTQELPSQQLSSISSDLVGLHNGSEKFSSSQLLDWRKSAANQRSSYTERARKRLHMMDKLYAAQYARLKSLREIETSLSEILKEYPSGDFDSMPPETQTRFKKLHMKFESELTQLKRANANIKKELNTTLELVWKGIKPGSTRGAQSLRASLEFEEKMAKKISLGLYEAQSQFEKKWSGLKKTTARTVASKRSSSVQMTDKVKAKSNIAPDEPDPKVLLEKVDETSNKAAAILKDQFNERAASGKPGPKAATLKSEKKPGSKFAGKKATVYGAGVASGLLLAEIYELLDKENKAAADKEFEKQDSDNNSEVSQ